MALPAQMRFRVRWVVASAAAVSAYFGFRRVLAAARLDSGVAGESAAGVPVDVFTMAEALAFLAERTGLADEAGAREVAEELGCLPLGLAQATAVMVRERLGYGAYLERLRTLPVDEHLGRVEGDPYPRGVAEAVLLSLAGVEGGDEGGLCGAVMDLVGVLSEAGVPRTLLQAAGDSGVLAGSGGRETGPGGVSSVRMDAAIGRLADGSLLGFSVDGSLVSADRLIMRVVRERRSADGKLAAVAAAAVTVLASLAGAVERVREDPAAVRDLAGQITALDEHVTGHLAGLGVDSTESLLRLRVRGMWLVNELDDSPGQVIGLGVPLAADCERVLGADHPGTLAARFNLAYAYESAGRLGEAIPLYEQVLAGRERVLGADHPDALASRFSLACVYESAGRPGEAIPLFEQALADYERVLGAGHPDTLTSRKYLAHAYEVAEQGEMIALFEQALAARERVLGVGHPDTLTSRFDLADAYASAGRLGEAIALYEQLLADCERVLGADHSVTLTIRENLAATHGAAKHLRGRKRGRPRLRPGQIAAKASSRMESPSSSRSSPITSGGRKRITLLNVPQVSVTSPAWWQARATAAVVAGSGSSVPGVVSSIASIAPRPRTSAMTGYFSASPCSRGSMMSPIRRARPVRSSATMVSIAPSAAAQATGLPPYVPPRPPTCTESMISVRPVTPPSGSPPAMPLAVVIRSGTTASCSQANQSPVRQNPVWISSAMKTIPCSRQNSASPGRNPSGGTTNPPSPWIGSMITAATLSSPTWV